MIVNGFQRKNILTFTCSFLYALTNHDADHQLSDADIDWGYVINNDRLFEIVKTSNIAEFYHLQQRNWIAHVIRRENTNPCKQITFHATKNTRLGKRIPSILDRAVNLSGLSKSQFIREAFRKLQNKK